MFGQDSRLVVDKSLGKQPSIGSLQMVGARSVKSDSEILSCVITKAEVVTGPPGCDGKRARVREGRQYWCHSF